MDPCLPLVVLLFQRAGHSGVIGTAPLQPGSQPAYCFPTERPGPRSQAHRDLGGAEVFVVPFALAHGILAW